VCAGEARPHESGELLARRVARHFCEDAHQLALLCSQALRKRQHLDHGLQQGGKRCGGVVHPELYHGGWKRGWLADALESCTAKRCSALQLDLCMQQTKQEVDKHLPTGSGKHGMRVQTFATVLTVNVPTKCLLYYSDAGHKGTCNLVKNCKPQ